MPLDNANILHKSLGINIIAARSDIRMHINKCLKGQNQFNSNPGNRHYCVVVITQCTGR